MGPGVNIFLCLHAFYRKNDILGSWGGPWRCLGGLLGSLEDPCEVPGGSPGGPWNIDVLHFLICFIRKSEHWLLPRVRDVCSCCLLAPFNSFGFRQNSSCFIDRSETM